MSRSEDIKILQTGLSKRYARTSNPLPSKPPISSKGNTALPAYDRAISNLQSTPSEQNKVDEKSVRQQLKNFSIAARDVSSITRVGQERLQRVSIPGGIWVPLSILLSLMFVLVPVNGHTRIVWFFLSLFGLAHVNANFGTAEAVGTATGGGPDYSTGIGTQAPQQASTPYTGQYQEGYTPYRPYDDVIL
jgi:hypothetical protein